MTIRNFKDLDKLRIEKNLNFKELLNKNLISKEEFKTCVVEVMNTIKNNYEKSGFKTDVYNFGGLKWT